MPPNKQISPDTVRQDTQHVLDYLRALAAALPGRVDDDLLAFLEGASTNPYALDLLVGALIRGKP